MRIALFTDTYFPNVNGVSRTMGRLVSHAARRGHEVGLFTPSVSDEPAQDTAFHHQLPGVPLPMYPELQLAWPLDRRGKELLEHFRPDLVHVSTESTVGWSGRAWALQGQVPLVTSFHTDWPAYLEGYGFGGLENPVWHGLQLFHGAARATFCPSSATERQLRFWGFTHDVRIWSRGVDTLRFSPAHRREELRRAIAPEGEKILVYVGRLAPEKRLDLLMEAFPLIREAYGPGVVLALVGDGPWMEELRARDVKGVIFLGYRTGDALAQAYAAGDVFAFPSDTETFGNVVMEALASGLPVVAPARGGVVDSVLPGQTGLLVPPGDPHLFASAVLLLLNNEEERARLARGARALALQRGWETIMDRLFDDYLEVLTEERAPGRARERLGF